VTAKPIRVSLVVLDLLAAIDRAAPDDPPWGLRLCEETGYGSGTVYPALDKLLRAGWIADRWEEPQPSDRPRRRFYALTEDGRTAVSAPRTPGRSRPAPSRP